MDFRNSTKLSKPITISIKVFKKTAIIAEAKSFVITANLKGIFNNTTTTGSLSIYNG